MRTVLCHQDGPIFATAFYLIADLGKKELRYANAGHPGPLFRDRRTGEVGALLSGPGAQGPALGLFGDAVFATSRRAFHPDDLFILFTDGLYEAADAKGTPFGSERLLQGVRDQGHRSTSELFDFLLKDAKVFSNRKTFEDDVCILGIEMLPCASGGSECLARLANR